MDEAAAALKEEGVEEAMPPLPQFLTAKPTSPRTGVLKQICREGLPHEETRGQVSLVRFFLPVYKRYY